MKVELTGAMVTVAVPTIVIDHKYGEIAASVNVRFCVKGRDEIEKWWRATQACSFTKVTIEIPEQEDG